MTNKFKNSSVKIALNDRLASLHLYNDEIKKNHNRN